jgi:hypothetical protein
LYQGGTAVQSGPLGTAAGRRRFPYGPRLSISKKNRATEPRFPPRRGFPSSDPRSRCRAKASKANALIRCDAFPLIWCCEKKQERPRRRRYRMGSLQVDHCDVAIVPRRSPMGRSDVQCFARHLSCLRGRLERALACCRHTRKRRLLKGPKSFEISATSQSNQNAEKRMAAA